MKLKHQILFSILTGVLVCISFPTLIAGVHFPEMGWLIWIALVPLFFAINDATPRRAFTLTFIAAAVWYSGSLFWVYRAMHTFGRLPVFTSFMVLILLVVIVSVYISLAPLFAKIIEKRWRGESIILLPVCWMAMEIFKNYFPCNGFPWSNLAMSQWKMLPVIQIADIVGIYGLIFLIVWVNVFIVEVIGVLRHERKSFFVPKCVTTCVLLAVTLIYGAYKISSVENSLSRVPSLSVGLIQGNISQDEKWEKGRAEKNLNTYRAGTRRLLESPVDIVIWPESAFPWTFNVSDNIIDPRALGLPTEFLGRLPHTLFGAISENDTDNYFNSAILADGSGNIVAKYHKAHLVPFGEYVPYKKLLFFARKLTQPVGTFLSGNSYEPLKAAGVKFGVLICYEDVFPEISRKTVLAGAEFLANLTNDAWYGVSSAAFQHVALSVFRAVENRRFLVRATNTGVSAVIMPTGKIMIESGIFEPALIVSPIALLNNITPYTRLGDWFAWGCVAYMLFGLIMVIGKRFRRQ